MMEMALTGKNRHYRWGEMQSRHWLLTANKVGLSATVEEDVAGLVAKTPGVIKAVGEICQLLIWSRYTVPRITVPRITLERPSFRQNTMIFFDCLNYTIIILA